MLHKMRKTDSENTDNPTRWNILLQSVGSKKDRADFQTLYNHFAPLIKAYAYKATELSKAEAIAEELAQETMIKVWKKADTFNSEKASASTWIFTVARNTRIDLLRKYNKQWEKASEEFDENFLNADDIWDDKVDNIEKNIEASHTRKIIKASVNELPIEQLTVIRSIFMEGLSHSEAAAALNLPLGTVKSRVRLALQKLKLSIDI